MKNFRLSWYAVLEDESVLEGRSLVRAETQEKAIEELFVKKAYEYRLKPSSIKIGHILEMNHPA
ncbi:hypothetical protein LS684_03870 [Cytobacillus spongiae]|jgi:ribosomal protein L20A (L18A)|uniref:hypothetical protein n=1 Tax=Cytobacillus spongiae TaxID=2901381 RepID=UPI001F1C6A83|nr:hypothetical protein [Cytobacillus spongiae]UII56633.1 hypothetical protein LS684_03870 [Cytobacillus spongiae]